MLTPYFQLQQTENQLTIIIHAPYANLSVLEVYVEKDDFRFYASPYYLRLHLPGHVQDSLEPTGKYDTDKCQFEIVLDKSVSGEHFPDLDLIGRLLTPSKKKLANIKPDIQVLSGSDAKDGCDTVEGSDSEEDQSDEEWWFNQEEPTLEQSFSNLMLSGPRYGFSNKYQGVFNIVKDEFKEIIDLPDIEKTPLNERTKLRKSAEDEKFSDDYYICDFMEPDMIREILEYKSPREVSKDEVKLTENELQMLKNFGNKEYLLSKEERRIALLSLVDILFAFVYDEITTLGEETVESAWTINKLSATLSWLQVYESPNSVVETCIRRALCYPLYRHWKLSCKVLLHTINILKRGKRQILKCFLKIHKLFSESEPRYLLNQLYVTDYCIWLQTVSDKKLLKLAETVMQVPVTKTNIGFNLELLEKSALSDILSHSDSSGNEISDSETDSKDTESDSDDSDSDLDSDDLSEEEKVKN